jgi:hypothetical protein
MTDFEFDVIVYSPYVVVPIVSTFIFIKIRTGGWRILAYLFTAIIILVYPFIASLSMVTLEESRDKGAVSGFVVWNMFNIFAGLPLALLFQLLFKLFLRKFRPWLGYNNR